MRERNGSDVEPFTYIYHSGYWPVLDLNRQLAAMRAIIDIRIVVELMQFVGKNPIGESIPLFDLASQSWRINLWPARTTYELPKHAQEDFERMERQSPSGRVSGGRTSIYQPSVPTCSTDMGRAPTTV